MSLTAYDDGVQLWETLDRKTGTCIPSRAQSRCSGGEWGLSRFFFGVGLLQAQVFGFFGVVRAPNGLRKPLMGERLSLLHNHGAQNLKLFGTKECPLASNVNEPVLEFADVLS